MSDLTAGARKMVNELGKTKWQPIITLDNGTTERLTYDKWGEPTWEGFLDDDLVLKRSRRQAEKVAAKEVNRRLRGAWKGADDE